MGDLDMCKGKLTQEECRPSSNPLPTAIDVSIMSWAKVDLRTREIISQIQPTIISKNQSMVVVQKVQCILRRCIGCGVFSFGYVPLKTYLYDGDIDLTAFNQHNVTALLAKDIYSVNW